MGQKPETGTRRFLESICGAILALSALAAIFLHQKVFAGQTPKSQDPPISVRFTDVRKDAGITFLQDSTQTDEKYYLETMGTGVGWIDYNQDGLMDLFFVQSSATDVYKPAHPLRSALYRNNGDGTFTDVTEQAGVGGAGHYGQG
ncbi:MAG: VCBS repeat-containing protein, partial [Candidatus Acidiferrum sp.]